MEGCIRNQILELLYEGKLTEGEIFNQFRLPIRIFYKLLKIMKSQQLVFYNVNAMPETFVTDDIYPPGVNIQLCLSQVGKDWTKRKLIDKIEDVEIGGNDRMHYIQWEKAGMRIPEFEKLTYSEYKAKFIHCARSAKLDNRMLYYIMTGKLPTDSKSKEPAIAETLKWLSQYDKAYQLFLTATQKYDKMQLDRSLLDDLRLSIECFYKDFFGNQSPLEKQGDNIKNHFRGLNVSTHVANMYSNLNTEFYRYQNDAVKHNLNYTEIEVEFMIEICSSFMRMLIKTK